MNEMKLSGVTQASGGVYEDVKVEGVATVNGDIECKDLSIQGVSTFKGSIICADALIEGTCKLTGGIRASKFKLSGLLTIGKDFEAEAFCGTGSFNVAGVVNADSVDIRFVYGSSASEVCGQDIKIRKEKTNAAAEFIMELIPWRHKGKNFECKMIEGDYVDIDSTHAGIVRGKSVIIGPECDIDTVEYHDKAEIHPSAKVRSTIKLEG